MRFWDWGADARVPGQLVQPPMTEFRVYRDLSFKPQLRRVSNSTDKAEFCAKPLKSKLRASRMNGKILHSPNPRTRSLTTNSTLPKPKF